MVLGWTVNCGKLHKRDDNRVKRGGIKFFDLSFLNNSNSDTFSSDS